MKYIKLAALFVAIIVAMSATKPVTDPTIYYWFTAGNVYLHTNLIDDEIQQSGYDDGQYNPKTLQEKGYTISQLVTINPPRNTYPPSFPQVVTPTKRLYSHP